MTRGIGTCGPSPSLPQNSDDSDVTTCFCSCQKPTHLTIPSLSSPTLIPPIDIFPLSNEVLFIVFQHITDFERLSDNQIPCLKFLFLFLVNYRFTSSARCVEQQHARARYIYLSQTQRHLRENATAFLFHVEKNQPYLYHKVDLPYYGCLRVLDNVDQVNFTDNIVQRGKGLGKADRGSRFCLDCGFKEELFGLDQVLVVRGSHCSMHNMSRKTLRVSQRPQASYSCR